MTNSNRSERTSYGIYVIELFWDIISEVSIMQRMNHIGLGTLIKRLKIMRYHFHCCGAIQHVCSIRLSLGPFAEFNAELRRATLGLLWDLSAQFPNVDEQLWIFSGLFPAKSMLYLQPVISKHVHCTVQYIYSDIF